MDTDSNNITPRCRESFTFHRSFYEAIRCMPQKVQAELYPALMEYALFGVTPNGLSEIAYGVFILIKPTIDVNTARYENGKKGGRRRVPSIDVSSFVQPQPLARPVYSASFDDEVAQMKKDTTWLEQGVCIKFHISLSEASARLDEFLTHLYSMCADKPHDSYSDAQRHFCSWYRKEFRPFESKQKAKMNVEPNTPTDYNFNGGFGGIDT